MINTSSHPNELDKLLNQTEEKTTLYKYHGVNSGGDLPNFEAVIVAQRKKQFYLHGIPIPSL